MDAFIYPANIIPDNDNGGFVVRFADFPEAITQGETMAVARHEAANCLEEAIANRIVTEMDIPLPSPAELNKHPISLSTAMSIKAALYLSLCETNTTEAELAQRLMRSEQDVHQLFDPFSPTDLGQVEDALVFLGRQLSVSVLVKQSENVLAA